VTSALHISLPANRHFGLARSSYASDIGSGLGSDAKLLKSGNATRDAMNLVSIPRHLASIGIPWLPAFAKVAASECSIVESECKADEARHGLQCHNEFDDHDVLYVIVSCKIPHSDPCGLATRQSIAGHLLDLYYPARFGTGVDVDNQ
jgi:hypothetical protein